jgi:hypothetical protein
LQSRSGTDKPLISDLCTKIPEIETPETDADAMGTADHSPLDPAADLAWLREEAGEGRILFTLSVSPLSIRRPPSG